MYALGALTAKKAESVGVSALLHEKSENWGLGFGTEGKPPTGNASAEELKNTMRILSGIQHRIRFI